MRDGRYTLLFVDDEPDVVDILARTFQDDYDVVTAGSGAAALKVLETRQVDLLISDQRMPGMTGVQLIEKARERDPELTSIILTAYTDPPDLIDAINRGQVYRYVTKPWDIQDLVLTVDSALERVRLRRENVSLLAEAQHRLAALEVLYEVSRAAATLSTYPEIVDQVTALLERVVNLDVSATLVHAEADRPATLTLRTRSPVAEGDLEAFQEAVLERHRALTGEALPESEVLVRVTGRRSGAEAAPQGSLQAHLFIPLHTGGRPTGLLAVAARREGAFTRDDEKVLDILANQTAEAIVALRGKLDAERQRMRRMVEGMADGLVMTDATGEVVVANAAARELLGVPESQPMTARFLQDVLGFYPFELVRGWERQGARPVSEDLAVGDRFLHSVVSPVTEGDGHLAGVVVVLRDVTEARQLEKRKEDFVSLISHELRTPLTSITASIDLILNGLVGEVSEKQHRYLKLAKDSSDRLNTIVDDLLDLASIARGKLKLELKVAALDEVVAEAVERYEAAFQKRGLEVAVKRPPSPVRVLIDLGRLDQVINNLLTNATKFTPEGGRVEVEVFRHDDVGGTAGFSVWNNGDEIPGGDLERIFEQFEQGHGNGYGKVRGTGLGLPICRSIVEAHGGRIWAENTSGQGGARFVVTLPLEGVAEAEGAATAEADVSPAAVSGDAPRVLVVDDDRGAAYALKGVLLSGGYAVEVATAAEEALSLARRKRPAAIVIDVHMPDIDGVRVIEILRHDPDTRGVPVLAISGVEDGTRALRAGAQSFLAKPLESSRLLASVATLITGPREGRRVLVVDDDAGIRALCAETLASLGYNVAEAESAYGFLEQLRAFRPDLVLLDVNLPDGDGFTLLEALKADRATSFTSAIFISARSDTRDKVRALRLGGDDYLVKPFDALELAARVDTVLRRRESELAASPTTRLPGGVAIQREASRRLESGEPFTLCYLDLDNLKAFNDYYGYAKADGVIHQTGDLIREVVELFGTPDDFIGHVAGDDFVFITRPEHADRVCREVIAAFDRLIPLYYDREDRQRGYIEAEDRYGERRRFPVMSVSVVAVSQAPGRFTAHTEMAAVAAGLKKRAKAIEGSVYLRDDAANAASA